MIKQIKAILYTTFFKCDIYFIKYVYINIAGLFLAIKFDNS